MFEYIYNAVNHNTIHMWDVLCIILLLVILVVAIVHVHKQRKREREFEEELEQEQYGTDGTEAAEEP